MFCNMRIGDATKRSPVRSTNALVGKPSRRKPCVAARAGSCVLAGSRLLLAVPADIVPADISPGGEDNNGGGDSSGSATSFSGIATGV
jgi:hypothetical protein